MKQKDKRRKEVRLRVNYGELKGLTISLHQDSHEVVCHLQMHADIRMSCQGSRKEIVDTIKLFYATKTRDNLPVYGVRQRNLGMYTTQEGDVVKGISRVPLGFTRLREEDLVDIQKLTIRASQCFYLPERNSSGEDDDLNMAFSSIVLQKSTISNT